MHVPCDLRKHPGEKLQILRPEDQIGTAFSKNDRKKEGGRFPALYRPIPAYWSSFRTSCCIWLAWANEEMPVCSRIEYLVRFATAVGISAAIMPFSAEVRFCTWLLMTLLALCSRLMTAPIWPRCPATV